MAENTESQVPAYLSRVRRPKSRRDATGSCRAASSSSYLGFVFPLASTTYHILIATDPLNRTHINMNEPFIRELERGFAELLLTSRAADASEPTQTAIHNPASQCAPTNCDQESTTASDATAQANSTARVRERLQQMASFIDRLDHRDKKLARGDRNTRRKQERENRTLCVSCKQRKPPGTAMFTCSLCK